MQLSAALCYSDSTHFHISTEATLLRCFLFELCHRFAILLEFLHTGVSCVQPSLVEHQMLSHVLRRNLIEVAPCWRHAACGRQCGRSPGPCCYLAALDVRTWLFEVTSSGLHMCKVRRTVLDEARRLREDVVRKAREDGSHDLAARLMLSSADEFPVPKIFL